MIGSRVLGSRSSFVVKSHAIRIQGTESRKKLPFRVIPTNCDCSVGMQIRITGVIIPTKERRVAATIIAADEILVIKKSSLINSELNQIRDDFVLTVRRFKGDAAALIPGLVIGDTRLQSHEFSELMRSSGLSHLTAVSGANFAIVSTFIFWFTGWFLPNRKRRLIFSGAFLIFFLLLVRPSPSVLRAAAMASVTLISRYRGKQSVSATALATAISLLLIADPFQAFDPGFVLSVLATSALIFIAPILEQWFSKFLVNYLAELLSISVAAGLACAPYLLFLSGEISAVSILLNTLVAPVVGVVTVIAFVAVLFSPTLPEVSYLLVKSALPFSQWIVTVANLQQNALTISANWIVIIILFALFIFALKRRSITGLIALAATLVICLHSNFGFPGRNWDIGQCDVGQGDALLVNLGGGHAALFDAGPDRKLLLKCLRQFGVKKLPLIVISHNHADHIVGLMRGIPVQIGEIWVNQALPELEFPSANVRVVRSGEKYRIRGIDLEVIWPENILSEFTSLGGDGSKENNKSIVIKVVKDNVGILITGDVEPEAQDEILSHHSLSNLSIIKVPHHGSRFQSMDFLARVGARFAFISVGAGNSYGHPSSDTINYLAATGATVFRTDCDGAISLEWHSDASRSKYVFSARTSERKWWQIQWR